VVPFDGIRRLHLAHFVAPASHPLAGKRIVVGGYVVPHPDGLVLFDTGLGLADEETERLVPAVRGDLTEALSHAGHAPDEVRMVVNCHLHYDHAGWNKLFPGVPILAQRRELEDARTEDDYTMADVYEYPGATFELLDGEAEPLPGLTIVPTPGHTPGHQSLAVRTDRGTAILAGQAFLQASEYALARVQRRLRLSGEDPDADTGPKWLDRLDAFEPVRVAFAHDEAVWEPQ
jgi:glyoxylase-like metal-dependent hydrolase (beta-lactamase superfamily II)